MTFLLPAELVDEADRPGLEASAQRRPGARARRSSASTRRTRCSALARDAGFRDVAHVASATLAERYFAGRADGLRPSTGEDLLLATT